MKRVLLFFTIIFLGILTSDVYAQLTDVTNEIGISHAHAFGQLMGGGIGSFDFDNDGFEDLLLTGGEGPDRLLINNRNGGYIDRSEALPHNQFKSEITTGVTHADFNNDGCVDLFITSFNREENSILLQNDCDGGFKEVTNRAGIIENSSSIGATVIDYDLDGDLDIYVINYIWQSKLITNDEGETIGFDHICAPNFLYENEGNMRFKEIAGSVGAQGSGCALAVTSFNFIENAPAIYIANDFGEWIQPNELLMYDKESGLFTDVASNYGLDYGLYGMGITIADPDRDDDLDIYVSNLGQNAYLENVGNNFYSESALSYGIDNTYTPDSSLAVSWGVLFNDFDNDLWPDLFVSNGWIPSAEFIGTSFTDPCKYYSNNEGSFKEESTEFGLDFDYINRGVATIRLDHDGYPDAILSGLDDTNTPEGPRKYRFLHNNYLHENHFLEIELTGELNNKEAYGALIELYHGNEKEIQINYPGGTYCSHGTKIIHFGLGSIDNVDSVKVHWPDGQKDVIYDIPLDQHLMLYEGGNSEIVGCMNEDDPYFNPTATLNSGCKLDNTTSIGNTESIKGINIFPNLVSNEFFINAVRTIPDLQVQLMDMTGKVHINKEIHLHANTPFGLPIPSFLTSGIYIIQLKNAAGHQSFLKIIVQK